MTRMYGKPRPFLHVGADHAGREVREVIDLNRVVWITETNTPGLTKVGYDTGSRDFMFDVKVPFDEIYVAWADVGPEPAETRQPDYFDWEHGHRSDCAVRKDPLAGCHCGASERLSHAPSCPMRHGYGNTCTCPMPVAEEP